MGPAARNRGRAGLALSALVGIVWGAQPTAAAPRQVPNRILACGGGAVVMGVAMADTVEVDTGVAYGRVAMPDSTYWGQRFSVLRATTTLPADTVVLARWTGSMIKDSKRFPKTDGWGYATFQYDTATDTWSAKGDSPEFVNTCHGCHTVVKARDFVFTDYPKR